MDDLQGSTLQGYELQERIGAGGFGAVYRARQTTIGREVAIKIILPGFANNPDFIRRFETEAHLIARLEHPHITPLHDYWRDPNGAYLVMRYLKGGSIRDSLKAGAYDLQSASRVLDQIASALDFAHRNEVIHRDIKPGNILLDEDGNAYLADFGIAKDLTGLRDGQTGVDAVVGSLDYISPEQARSEPVTPRTDIYSLGVALYEMITGEHPFKGSSSVERLYKHINDRLPEIDTLPDDVRDAVNEIIQRATAKDPDKRYPDVLALAAAFREGVGRGQTQRDLSIVEQLTLREQEILRLIADGRSNGEIAQKLVVTMATVKWHISQLYKKLGVRSRVQAIVRARELNLIVTGDTSDRLRDAVPTPTVISLPEPENPYKGLQAFQMTDARDFFGREELTEKLVNHLREDHLYHRFLAIVGPSGSGKSSVVKAGLIPALWNGAFPGSEKWFVVDMIPGTHPLDKLETALIRVAANHAQNLREQLQRDDRGLLRVADIILPADGSELVIVVDQFEEVFTLVEEEATRQQFLDLLRTAATDKRSRVRVVITLRADYYDRPLHYPEFGDMVRSRMETVLPLSAKGLEQAIRGPAERVGVTFEPGLVAQMVSETNYQSGALPLLQYALTELFNRREGRLLTLAAYQDIGGAVGALANRADEIFDELTPEGQALARQMFLRLVTLGEGAEDTRRRATQAELLSLTANTDLMEEVIDQFAAYRLLSLDHDPATRQPTVEVAHEAILREWERLRQWLNAFRDDIRQERMVAQAAEGWMTNHRDSSYLLSGTRLEQAEKWREITELALTPLEQAYIGASIAEQERETGEKHAQEAREARLERRTRRILQLLAAVFALAAVLSGGFGLFALNARNAEAGARRAAETAEQEALRQASIGLAAQAVAELNSGTPERGVLLALEALEHYPYTPQAERALAQTVYATRRYISMTSSDIDPATISAASFSSDGTRVVTTSESYDGVIWDAASGQALKLVGDEYLYNRPVRMDVAWSPDDLRLVTVVNSPEAVGRIEVWDALTGDKIAAWGGHDDKQIWAVDWLDDDRIITGGADNKVRIWQAATGEEVQTLSGHTGEVRDVTLSPDGKFIASASADNTVRIWDAHTGAVLHVLSGHLDAVNAVDWSPDSARLISGGDDGIAIIWDATSGEVQQTIAGHTDAVLEVVWSPDGMLVVTASADGVSRVWDVLSGALVSTIQGKSLAWSPDGARLIVGLGVASLRMWDMSQRPLRLVGHDAELTDGKWSPDGARIVTTSFDNTTRVWDATSGENTLVFDHPGGEISFVPDSDWAVTGGFSATYVWNIESGEERFVFPWPDDGVVGHAVSPDGTRMVLFGDERSQMIDLATGDTLFEFNKGFEGGCFFLRLAWSPDGRHFTTPCSYLPRADIWDAQTGDLVRTLPHDDGVNPTGWSPDGTRILTADLTGVVHVWNAQTGELIFDFRGHTSAVYDAEWSPNGNYIASGDDTGTVRIWNAQTGQEVNVYNVGFGILGVNWSPDGSQLITTGFYNVPDLRRVWQTTEELIAYARECCVFRNLTPEEREQFGLPQRPT